MAAASLSEAENERRVLETMLAAEQAKVSALQEDNQLLISGTTAEVQDQAVQASQVPISGALSFYSDHDLRRNAERGDLVPVSHLPDSF